MTPRIDNSKTTTYVIGTDEAGYGPNLGPLLVAASCWTISPESLGSAEILRRAFSPSPAPPDDESQSSASSNVKKPTKRRDSKKQPDVGAASLFDFLPDAETPVAAPKRLNDSASEINGVSLGIDAVVPLLNDSLAELCARRGVLPLDDSKNYPVRQNLWRPWNAPFGLR